MSSASSRGAPVSSPSSLIRSSASRSSGSSGTRRGTYFVGFDRNTVDVYKGQPGGVLWFQPTVVKHYDLQRDDVPEGKLNVIDDGKPRSSER